MSGLICAQHRLTANRYGWIQTQATLRDGNTTMTRLSHNHGSALLIVLLMQIPLGLIALYWSQLIHTENALMHLGRVRVSLLLRTETLLRKIETTTLRGWSSRNNTIPFNRPGVRRSTTPFRFRLFDWNRRSTLNPAADAQAVIEYLGVYPTHKPAGDVFRITIRVSAPNRLQQILQSVCIRYWSDSAGSTGGRARLAWNELLPTR